MNNFTLDTYIKTRFQLFEGMRSHEKDQEIYDKVFDLCLDEILEFASENLTTGEIYKLGEQLNAEDSLKVISEALQNIPDASLRLNARLTYFIDQLLLDSLYNVANK